MKRLIAPFLLIAIPALAMGSVPASFQDYRNYLIGSSPTAVVLADLNNDGNLDAVVASSGGTLALLGQPGGTLAPPVVVQPTFSMSIAVADFNNDGNLDIVSTILTNGTQVNLALGNGNGTFQSPRLQRDISCVDCFLAAGDFNADGRMDLAVANTSSLVIYLGLGCCGIFAPRPPSYPLSFVTAITAADLDHDGRTDLVVTDFGANSEVVFKNNGRASFTSTSYPSGQQPIQAVLVDLNGDFLPDLAVVDKAASVVQVRVNLGGGAFGPMTSYSSGGFSTGITSGDFNKDGKPDIATPLSVLYGNGDGTLQAPAGFFAGTSTVTSGDFNHDGYSDLIVTTESTINISVLFGGAQPVTQPRTIAAGTHPKALATGDFNGDGKADLAVAASGDNQVHILLSTGSGTFNPAPDLAAPTPGAIVVKDFNHDNKQDLAIGGDSGTWIYLGRGDGTFQFAAQYPSFFGDCTPTAFSTTAAPCLASADFNNDNIPDLVAALWINGTVSFLLGNGDGTFRAGPQTFAVSDVPQSIVAGDFDKDSKTDLVISSAFGSVYVYAGNGNGTFGTPSKITVGSTGAGLAVGDVDGDNDLDLVLASGSGSSVIGLSVAFLTGKGDLTFNSPVALLADMAPNAVILDDFNNDGLMDIAAANFEADDVSIFINNGSRTFQPEVLYGAHFGAVGLVSADLNSDNKRDIIVVNQFSNDLAILLNSTP